VLVGHSIAGAELSSIATRRPERVAGVVYLDAAYGYAFDNGKGASFEQMMTATAGIGSPPPPGPADVVSFETLRAWYLRNNGIVYPEAELRATEITLPDGRPGPPREAPGAAVSAGVQKYAAIRAPALAIFASPHDLGPWVSRVADPQVHETLERVEALVVQQANAFEEGVPGSRVVRFAGANHYVFLSNEPDVLRELRAFVAGLRLDAPPRP
jgi:pimeloyl-ACP methyl ester carboxylesterase